MRLFFTKKDLWQQQFAPPHSTSIIPAVPVYAGTRTQQSSNSRNEKNEKGGGAGTESI